jgi:hypothetical protein
MTFANTCRIWETTYLPHSTAAHYQKHNMPHKSLEKKRERHQRSLEDSKRGDLPNKRAQPTGVQCGASSVTLARAQISMDDEGNVLETRLLNDCPTRTWHVD